MLNFIWDCIWTLIKSGLGAVFVIVIIAALNWVIERIRWGF